MAQHYFVYVFTKENGVNLTPDMRYNILALDCNEIFGKDW